MSDKKFTWVFEAFEYDEYTHLIKIFRPLEKLATFWFMKTMVPWILIFSHSGHRTKIISTVQGSLINVDDQLKMVKKYSVLEYSCIYVLESFLFLNKYVCFLSVCPWLAIIFQLQLNAHGPWAETTIYNITEQPFSLFVP